MNILYVGLARSLWLFETALLNPRGISLQAMIDGIRERYGFVQGPKHQLDFDERHGLTFKSGTFSNSKGLPILIVAFSIYVDGFVADTASSTDDSDEFLTDLTNWIRTQDNLAVPVNVRRNYVGQIDFETDAQLASLNPDLQTLTEVLEKRVKTPNEKPRQFEVTSLGLWSEDFGQPTAPSAFRWERKLNAPFSANHYFSQAPLDTPTHIAVLGAFERALKGKKDR